ncbi:hypothetical protein [Microbacterium sp. H83]|uniref:hypothetical protein n=1 Tax=Microbacterium sp. H83 TaxID=1827324 RepID=UPI0007F4229A|nr:hypothetical protein [Microbacterium sp. H83]OAN43259.1 hypothetical protein A4X16_08275 [Microbacterium sp. H83]
MNARLALTAPAFILAGMLSLTGCSAYDSLVHKHATSTFADVGAFDDEAQVDADWLPADATEVTVRTSTLEDATEAVVLLTSGSPLGGDCAEVERYSAPAWVLDDAPDPYTAKSIFVCGDWAVIAADGGWFGWTPNSEDERSAASAR